MAAFPTSGATFSFSQINTVLGRSATAQISLDDSELRKTVKRETAGSEVNLYSHIADTARCNIVISADETGVNLKVKCDASGYYAGKSYITLTINSGVVVGGSTSNSDSAVYIGGFTSGDVIEVVNNGEIIGYGGNGGNAGSAPGGMGGVGLFINFACTVTNNGTIAGGGGGGAAGTTYSGTLSSKFGGGTPYVGYGGPGGGGAGVPPGNGGTMYAANIPATQYGYQGTKTLGGAGNLGLNWGPTSAGGTGGSGGNLGNNGGDTAANTWYHPPLTGSPTSVGGTAGPPIRFGATATVGGTGSIIGTTFTG